MNNKILPIVLIITGSAFVIGSLFFILDSLTATEPSGLGEQITNILVLLLGAGAGIKGWIDLKNEKTKDKVQGQRTQELTDSPRSEQMMKGKGGTQKQKATNSADSKQHME